MIKLPFAIVLTRAVCSGPNLALITHHFNFRQNTIVLGLSRGGVAIAAAVANILRAPLDVLVVRKLRAPSHPEVTIGSIAALGYKYSTKM